MIDAARWAGRVCLLAGVLALGSGCASLRGTPAEPGAPIPLDASDPLLATLVTGWENTVAGRGGLRGGASLKLYDPSGSQRLDQKVVVARPARLRMEIQAFLVTVAILVVDRGRYDYHESVNDVRDAGPLYPGLLHDIAGVPLRLDQAVHFLLGGPPPRAGLEPAGGSRHPDGTVEVALHDAAGRLARELRFDAEGRLARAIERHTNGEVAWQVGYDRYRPVGDQPFAHRIAFEFPRFASRATVAYRSVELDPETPDALFRIEREDEARVREDEARLR